MTNEPSDAPSLTPSTLHETEHWFVLFKPAKMHTVAQRGGDENTVEAWLRVHRSELSALEECGLVHRLDYDTSGCLLVAKNVFTRTRLRHAFSGRGAAIRKSYLALVEGEHESGSFTLEFSSRHKGSAKVTVRQCGVTHTEAQVGECLWRVRESTHANHANATLLEVELIGPGRRHQIRAGLAYLGMPLIGDTLYGGAAAAGGVHLHAERLEVDGISVRAGSPAWCA